MTITHVPEKLVDIELLEWLNKYIIDPWEQYTGLITDYSIARLEDLDSEFIRAVEDDTVQKLKISTDDRTIVLEAYRIYYKI